MIKPINGLLLSKFCLQLASLWVFLFDLNCVRFQLLEAKLAKFIEDIIASPRMVDTIIDGEVWFIGGICTRFEHFVYLVKINMSVLTCVRYSSQNLEATSGMQHMPLQMIMIYNIYQYKTKRKISIAPQKQPQHDDIFFFSCFQISSCLVILLMHMMTVVEVIWSYFACGTLYSYLLWTFLHNISCFVDTYISAVCCMRSCHNDLTSFLRYELVLLD